MRNAATQRLIMAGIGALAGGCCYLLAEAFARGWMDQRWLLALTACAGCFFNAVLALTGPLPPRRAAVAALALALVVAALLTTASLRHETVEGFLQNPLPVMAAVVIGLIPLPFAVAAAGPGWRDYPALFTAAWTIVVRFAAAWLFTGLVWAVIWLSNALLSLVGLTVIADLIRIGAVPWVVTGVILGLALAVVDELADVLSPDLLLRLLRLLVPAVLLVLAVFILALPLRGLSGLFGDWSAAGTLLAMAVAAATLVTTAVDRDDAHAVPGAAMRAAARALALVLPVPGMLAVWAVWLRVADHGLTPERVAAGAAAAVMLGYGLLYGAAALHRTGWMARIRRANVAMALVVVAMAALWLTPLLNAERMAAQSQLARFTSGATPLARLDVAAISRWGRAGERVIAVLEDRAAAPGQAALAALLKTQVLQVWPVPAGDVAGIAADLAASLPVVPAGQEALRAEILALITPEEQRDWLNACLRPLPQGGPGCVVVAGAFWPQEPGPQALVILRDPAGWVRTEGFGSGADGLQRRMVQAVGGAADEALITALQKGGVSLVPAPLAGLPVPGGMLLLLP